MAALRSGLEEAGMTVRHTYGQSGNIVFDAPRASATALAARIQAAVKPKLARPSAAVVLSARQLGRVLADAPADWGSDDAAFARHVVFVVPPVTARQVLRGCAFDAEIERVSSRGRVIYWSIRKDARARSGMSRLARTPAYRHMTVRTHALARELYARAERP
jgi:uncharacterized protein (DUF1697 family)